MGKERRRNAALATNDHHIFRAAMFRGGYVIEAAGFNTLIVDDDEFVIGRGYGPATAFAGYGKFVFGVQPINLLNKCVRQALRLMYGRLLESE